MAGPQPLGTQTSLDRLFTTLEKLALSKAMFLAAVEGNGSHVQFGPVPRRPMHPYPEPRVRAGGNALNCISLSAGHCGEFRFFGRPVRICLTRPLGSGSNEPT